MKSREVGLELLLLGRPIIRRGAEDLTDLPPLKSQALLFYLATTGRPVSRESLAALLWGDMTESTARANLRVALSRLRKVVGDCLDVDRQRVAFRFDSKVWVDVVAFSQALGTACSDRSEALHAATNLYRGPFLNDFATPDAPEFDAWVLTEREWFHQAMLAGLQKMLAADRTDGRYESAINVARRILDVAPWYEEAHQALMELLTYTGQRSAALAQYEICQRLLHDELGVPPSSKTDALRAQIAADALVDEATAVVDDQPPPRADQKVLSPAVCVHNAPDYSDSLLGRSGAVAEIRALLDDPACRLLTLVGAGGVGKTRLALAAAEEHAAQYPDGAYFVAFAGMWPAREATAADLVVNGIADALGFTLDAQQDPYATLLTFLKGQHLLLLCDNFEHLQPVAALFDEILLAAEQVQVIVTSRERLGAKHEWLYEVRGLDYRTAVEAGRTEELYPAAALFLRHAARVKSEFDLAGEATHIDAICRTLEGWPLSIELAANWLRLLPCASIAARLHADATLLDVGSTLPDDRHRSMRTVLEASWRLLSPEEQRACAGVAYFRGGFELNAAEAVVRAGLVQLGALVDKSFLRRDGDGRYHMHEQVRQFAADKLMQDPGTAAAIRRRHTAYYAALAASQQIIPGGVPEDATLTLLDQELRNLRLALENGLTERNTARVAVLLESLQPYFRYKGWNREITTTMAAACDLDDVPLALQARWQRWWADALYQMGELKACTARIEKLLLLLDKPVPATTQQRFWFGLREVGRQLLHRTLPLRPTHLGRQQRALLTESARALERYGQAGYFLDKQGEFLIGVAGINEVERASAKEFMAAAYATVALLLANMGIHRGAAQYQKLAQAYADADTNLSHRAYTLEIIGLNYFVMGDWAAALRSLTAAAKMADQSALRRFGLEIKMLIALAHGIPGDYRAALQGAATVLPQAQRLGDAIVQSWSLFAQAEFYFHLDEDVETHALPCLLKAEALPPASLNKSEHFRFHANMARAMVRTGNLARAAQELDRALAVTDQMAMLANWAFEGYAALPEAALALAGADLPPASRGADTNACVSRALGALHTYAKTHRFARPRLLIFQGELAWRQGKQRHAFSLWRKAISIAQSFNMAYDIARARLEIARHLAPDDSWDGLTQPEMLAQASAELENLGARFELSRLHAYQIAPARGAATPAPV